MIKRLNTRKHLNAVRVLVEENPGASKYKDLLNNLEKNLELYGSYSKINLNGYFWLETYQEKGLKIGFLKTGEGAEFYQDLIKFFDYCLLFLDWIYFSCFEGDKVARVIEILQKRKPCYKIRELDRIKENETVEIFYIAGTFQ